MNSRPSVFCFGPFDLCPQAELNRALRADTPRVGVAAADWRNCRARAGVADRSAQDPNNSSAAEGLAAKRETAVGAVSQATGQLHGALWVWMRWERWSQTCRVALQCSQESLFEIKHKVGQNRILGPGGTHGNLSLLGHMLPPSYLVSRSFWPSSLPLFANA